MNSFGAHCCFSSSAMASATFVLHFSHRGSMLCASSFRIVLVIIVVSLPALFSDAVIWVIDEIGGVTTGSYILTFVLSCTQTGITSLNANGAAL